MNIQAIQDIPRAYTALAEWLACMVYLSQFPLRIHGWKLVGVSAAMLGVQSVFLVATASVPLLFWMPCMGIAVGLMFLFLYLCGSVSVMDAWYSCVRAFILAEFAAALEWQLYCYGVLRFQADTMLVQVACLVLVYGLVFGFMYYLENRGAEDNYRMKVTRRELCSAVVIGIAVFFMSNLSYAYTNTPFSSRLITDIFNTRTMVDFGGLAVLYAYHVQRRELNMRYELDSIQHVLKNQYAQYRQSRESIEIVERKYHDLKHQIAALRAENDPNKRNEWLDEMEEDIKLYEAQNKTGNPVLDTVLTSKSLYCQKHGIYLTCVADGTKLDFMDVRDICTIFGNALDNAIECELGIADKAKRLIHVTVAAQKGFLLMRFENYCEGQLQFEEGVPVTTKKEKNYHGFGIKSIRYTAQKYGGSVKITVEDCWFEMKILIPIPDKK